MKVLSAFTASLYLITFFMCFIFVSKLWAVELIFVPQVAFAGLIMVEKMEALLQPLKFFFITNGYNLSIKDNLQPPPRVSSPFFGG